MYVCTNIGMNVYESYDNILQKMIETRFTHAGRHFYHSIY